MKSPRRQMYINLCVNHVKKLRDASEQSRDNDNLESSKRNPLANRSTLPSPPKRLKIEHSATVNGPKVSQNIENIIDSKPKNKTVKGDEITGT